MSGVETFKFAAVAELRVVEVAGEPWFVLADICRALDLGNAAMVARRLREEMKGVSLIDTPGGRQGVTIVSEAGLYEVAFRSDKPGAEEFRYWVTGTVLPSIRRTGSYGVAALDPTTPDGMRMVLQAATAALAELEVAKPKADAWDELAGGSGDYSVADAAKILSRAGIDIGRQRLFSTLNELRWIYRQSGRWQARQTAVDRGYLCHKAQSHRHPDTSEVIVDPPQVRVTPEGVRAIRDRLRESEPLPALTG